MKKEPFGFLGSFKCGEGLDFCINFEFIVYNLNNNRSFSLDLTSHIKKDFPNNIKKTM